MKLSILCISKIEYCCVPFILELGILANELESTEFVLIADGPMAFSQAAALDIPNADLKIASIKSQGYLESTLNSALAYCEGDYVLRIDDDECVSLMMRMWLHSNIWLSHDHWEFPRVHMWDNCNSVLMMPQLFPDFQTRLSIKAKAGDRFGVHAGSPFGGGERAPAVIEHHKFVIKDYETRREIAAVYDNYSPGYGTGNMKPFSLPEDAYKGQMVKLVSPWDGRFPWTPEGEREEQW